MNSFLIKKIRLTLVLLTTCFFYQSCTAAATISQREFEQIQVGQPINEMQEFIGSPYDVKKEKDGSMTYRYIERIEVGPGIIQQNTYLFKVINGKVVDKQCIDNSSRINIKSS